MAGSVGVLQLDDVDVVGAEACFLVRRARGHLGRRRHAVVDEAREGRVLAEDVAGEVRADLRGRDADRGALGGRRRRQHDRGRAFVRRAQHEEAERLADRRRREHLLDGDGLPVHRVRVVDTVRVVRDGDARQVLDPDVALAHEALRAEREVAGRRGQARLLAPRLEEGRTDHPARHLLEPEDEDALRAAGRDLRGAERERGAAARATGLDVDDRAARETERSEDLVPRGDAAVDAAAEGRVETATADAGFGERRAHGGRTDGREARVEPPEWMKSGARDVDRPHAARPQHFETTFRVAASSLAILLPTYSIVIVQRAARVLLSDRMLDRLMTAVVVLILLHAVTTPNPNGRSPR